MLPGWQVGATQASLTLVCLLRGTVYSYVSHPVTVVGQAGCLHHVALQHTTLKHAGVVGAQRVALAAGSYTSRDTVPVFRS